MFDRVRELIAAYLRAVHRDWDEDEVQFHASKSISNGAVTQEMWNQRKCKQKSAEGSRPHDFGNTLPKSTPDAV